MDRDSLRLREENFFSYVLHGVYFPYMHTELCLAVQNY